MTPHARHHAEPGMTARRTIPGFALTEFSRAPDCRLPRHEHRHASACFVVAGSYVERARGREEQCAAQSLVLKPAAEPHADVFGRAGGRCLLVEILPERIDSCSSVAAEPAVMRSATLAALGHRLHRELFARDEASSLALEGLALELLATASRAAAREPGGAEPSWLGRARELLHDRLGESLSLSSVAREVEVHPSHLARTFRRRHGCTLGEYLRRLRIERAARELAASSAMLSEIALRAGFFDQSHFARVFRRHTGMTPTEYRARVRATSA